MNTISIRRLGILFLLTLLVAAPMTAAAKDNGSEKVRVYVEYSAGHKNAVQGILARAGARFHYEFDQLNSFAVSLPEAALKGIEHNPNVVSVEEDPLRYLAGSAAGVSTTPQSSVTLTDQVIPYGVAAVWDKDTDWEDSTLPEFDGADRTVCIIDTGYDADHEDLPGDVVGMSQVDDNFAEDGYGHGSHVAGTIAGMDNGIGVVGVAPGANLYIVKIFDNDGEWVKKTHSSDLVEAAYTCAANGADIISMSLGGSQSTGKEKKAFEELYAGGILSIAAAGNDGNEEYSYPASYSSVISVAAIDEEMLVADFSQYNDAVELAAPGVGVLSTIPYTATEELVVGEDTYDGHDIEYSAKSKDGATGPLVDGGLCDATGDWDGKVVLCLRGDISFYDKVMNVENSGGTAAVIYNNESGNFLGTLGDDNTSTIPAISLSLEDGSKVLDSISDSGGEPVDGTVYNWIDDTTGGYEAWDGTSMATPHVSGVAALIWSANPTWSNEAIREAMQATAYNPDGNEYDNYYGFGLVQALDALDFLQSSDNE